jgi:hypothetical protein
MKRFSQFIDLMEERLQTLEIELPKPVTSNRNGKRYDNNMVGMRGKYFKRLDREGSMLSKRDRKAAHPRERLKAQIRQLGRGKKMVINRRQERMLADNGKRSITPTAKEKRLNSKTGATMKRRTSGGAEITG